MSDMHSAFQNLHNILCGHICSYPEAWSCFPPTPCPWISHLTWVRLWRKRSPWRRAGALGKRCTPWCETILKTRCVQIWPLDQDVIFSPNSEDWRLLVPNRLGHCACGVFTQALGFHCKCWTLSVPFISGDQSVCCSNIIGCSSTMRTFSPTILKALLVNIMYVTGADKKKAWLIDVNINRFFDWTPRGYHATSPLHY